MKIINKKGFTLVEIMVALTIFGLIMTSVMSVYLTTTDVSYDSELNRVTQENAKNIILDISEEIAKKSIKGLYNGSSSDCNDRDLVLPNQGKKYVEENMLCLDGAIYFLAKKSGNDFLKAQNDECDKIDSNCYIVKRSGENTSPLTNSLATIKKANFLLTNDGIKKVTISIELQPSISAGFKPTFAEKNVFNLQTTFTEKELSNNKYNSQNK